MPNLMLTNRCNFNCSYCFGADIISKDAEKSDLTIELFQDLLEWIQRRPGRDRTIHIMGGEPTLHEDFLWMTKEANKTGYQVSIFSNAASPKAAEYAEALIDYDIRWIVNINPPNDRTQSADENLRATLSVLGEKATLTFNMVAEPQPMDWAIELVCQYGLARNIKIGFTLPTLSLRNNHLKTKDYRKVAARVTKFASLCDAFNICFEYECGIPWCAFTTKQMGELWQYNSRFYSVCDSILDITPDGKVIYCLPLYTLYAIPYYKFDDYPQAKAWFESKLMPYRPLGSTSSCVKCNLMRSGHCRGGCLARVLQGSYNIKKGDDLE